VAVLAWVVADGCWRPNRPRRRLAFRHGLLARLQQAGELTDREPNKHLSVATVTTILTNRPMPARPCAIERPAILDGPAATTSQRHRLLGRHPGK
jgi:hypothetical protein